MADKLGIGSEVRKLRLGDSFMKNGPVSFHTMRYDFKPASVDVTKMANVDIGQGNQVAVTVPHIEGSGTAQTVFKGSKKPYTKECVLIIDPVSGEITLERLTNNIQVKKTRDEGSSKIQLARPITPVDHGAHRKASPSEKHSPGQKNPSSPNQKSSPYQMSPPQRNSPPYPSKTPLIPNNHRTSNQSKNTSIKPASMPVLSQRENEASEVGILSDSSDSSSSGSSSSSSDSSDSDSDNEMETVENAAPPPPVPVPAPNPPHRMPQFSQLSEDLQLSESGSDSD